MADWPQSKNKMKPNPKDYEKESYCYGCLIRCIKGRSVNIYQLGSFEEVHKLLKKNLGNFSYTEAIAQDLGKYRYYCYTNFTVYVFLSLNELNHYSLYGSDGNLQKQKSIIKNYIAQKYDLSRVPSNQELNELVRLDGDDFRTNIYLNFLKNEGIKE
jgi:hypothetical protein